jgi:DNA-binding GntR family transcriptional regulator
MRDISGSAPFANDASGGSLPPIDAGVLLSQSTRPATEADRCNLRLHAGAIVMRTHRLRRRDAAPVIYEEAALAVSRLLGWVPGREIGNYSVLDLAQRHGIHLGRASEKLRLTPARPAVAKLLGVDPGVMLLQLDRLILSRHGDPIEWRKGLCRLEPKWVSPR